MRAAQLRADRPLAWKGVMVAGCIFDGARQARLSDDMLADVAKAAIADGFKTLDLLQGLKLLLAWCVAAPRPKGESGRGGVD